jgi:acyl-CoA reductase-like NAD-dependent aldehyde dehydrogenase
MAIAARAGAYIDGKERREGSSTFVSLDPSTGRPLAEIVTSSAAEVGEAVAAARAAFEGAWGEMPAAERGRCLARLAERISGDREELGELAARDAGIPISVGRADAGTAARYFEFYAGAADKLHGDTIPISPAVVDFTLREPWGVCGIIVPFNFPLQMFARSVSAALAAGNSVVVKTADAAPLVANALAACASAAGLPPGALNVVHGGPETGQALIEHPHVAHVSFTGSVATGSRIMESCAKQVKPLVLELGGKSAQLILDDTYLEQAAKTIAGGLFRPAGQACSAPTRILVRRDLHDRMLDALVAEAAAVTVGPAIEDPTMGPLISQRQLDGVLAAVGAAIEDGARLCCGGERLDDEARRGGFFVGPTVLADVDQEMAIAREEAFGPVLVVIPFDTAEEALSIANDSDLGLAAGVWTSDMKTGLHLARRLQVGQVFVNTYGAGGGVELPFGGYKRSGFGREKGLEALHEYSQLKNVCLQVA